MPGPTCTLARGSELMAGPTRVHQGAAPGICGAASGYGREMSVDALELYTEQKAVVANTSPKPMNPFGV